MALGGTLMGKITMSAYTARRMERDRREQPRIHMVRKRARDLSPSQTPAAPDAPADQDRRSISLSAGVGEILPFWRVRS